MEGGCPGSPSYPGRANFSYVSLENASKRLHARQGGPRARGLLPSIGYIGMCCPKGYGFSAVLVINRVSNLADFGHFGHKLIGYGHK